MATFSQFFGTSSRLAARWMRDDSGQDLIEYAMLTGLIVLVTLATVSSLGETVDSVLWQPLEPIVAQF